jgi:spore coat protein CotH
MNTWKIKATLITITTLILFSCKKEIFIPNKENIIDTESSSHSNGYPANYDIVFNQDKVNRLDIIFTAEEWQAMQTDLSQKQGGGGPGGFPSENPDYFHCEVNFNGLMWEHVGIRYKGNSSLRANSNKLPLRFDFDKWEYEFPEISDQRFYGFKELSMSSNYNDPSLLREKNADDLFRNFGVPAVQTAFYEVYIDEGTGTYKYYGVYTMTEVVFDTFLKNWFGSKSGNCYKPDGNGARFSTNGFTLDDFEQKTNEETNDRSDIQEMFDMLHADTRNSNPNEWRVNLERVFDVDGFLKYLAVNNTIQNWDTYGRMTHNYYLYHDPNDDLIKWIAWDNNEAFQNGKRGGSLSFEMSEVGDNWPLISFIIADSEYESIYKNHIKSFIESSFENNRMTNIYNTQESLLNVSANNEVSGYSYVNGQFNLAVQTLRSHNVSRLNAAQNYIQ